MQEGANQGFLSRPHWTEPARSGTGLLVRFGREPTGNRTNSNFDSNHAVQSGPTGGALVEEAPHVLAKGLALFLLHHCQVHKSTRAAHH
jgi:hypothetical protein